MPKYRILTNGLRYKIQRRYQILWVFNFWCDLGDVEMKSGWDCFKVFTTYYSSFSDAQKDVLRLKASDEKTFKKWRVVQEV